MVFLPISSLAQSYVTKEGSRLMLDGKSFYFSGTNQYYLFFKSKAMVDDVMERARAMGLNTMRTWAFCDGEWHGGHSLQPEPGVYHEETFRKLDYAIFKAESMGIRLVLSLVNNWESFGGMDAYVRWSPTANSHDDFYTDVTTRKLFKEYVSYVLNRVNVYTGRAYKDEPAILMWELANEPRVTASRVSDLYRWISEMASFVKSIDKNHLLSTGSEGDYASDVFQTHQSTDVDVVSFHMYPDHWGWSESQSRDSIKKQIAIAHEQLNKPAFCGEFGLRDRSQRDRVYKDWYGILNEKNADGALFWILSGRQDDGSLYPDYDGFTVYYPEDRTTVKIIQDFTQWMINKSGKSLDRTPPRVTFQSPTAGDALSGMVVFSGQVEDDTGVAEVTLNFGGAERQAVISESSWQFSWDTREKLDGSSPITLKAKDLEGNETKQELQISVQNGTPSPSPWHSKGEKIQDDGYHFIYTTSLHWSGSEKISGHFVARFYIRPDGMPSLGNHYESSTRYVGNPTLSKLISYHRDLAYYEIDMGHRTLEPAETLAFKGQLSQQDGGYRSYNDWTAADFKESPSSLGKLAWYLDGRLIAGSIP